MNTVGPWTQNRIYISSLNKQISYKIATETQ